MAAIPAPLDPTKKTLFDLPGEVRNQIYSDLLPDERCLPQAWRSYFIMNAWPRPGHTEAPLRQDGTKVSMNFMAASRAVYEEAASLIYNSLNFTPVRVLRTGDIEFFGKLITFESMTPATFRAAKRIKRLRLDIETCHPSWYGNICRVQDALFNFFSNFTPGHGLRSLSAKIKVEHGSRSQNFGAGHLSAWEVSYAHIAAFLLDPICTIRNIEPGSRSFALYFLGSRIRPWERVEARVKTLIESGSSVEDYGVFRGYFAALRELGSTMDIMKRSRLMIDYELQVDRLAAARIHGDVAKFRSAHVELLAAVTPAPQVIQSRPAESAFRRLSRQMVHLCHGLQSMLPAADTDTSSFNYTVAEQNLHDWQTRRRYTAKDACCEGITGRSGSG